jgi:hypothetical protein
VWLRHRRVMYYSYVYRRYVWLWPVVHKSGPSSCACEQLRTTARGASALGAELPVVILLVAHGGVRGNAGAAMYYSYVYVLETGHACLVPPGLDGHSYSGHTCGDRRPPALYGPEQVGVFAAHKYLLACHRDASPSGADTKKLGRCQVSTRGAPRGSTGRGTWSR